MTPQATRPQDTNGQFLSDEEIAVRENGQQDRRQVARAAQQQRRVAAPPDDAYDLGDHEFDVSQDIDPAELRQAPPRPSAATPRREAGQPATPPAAQRDQQASAPRRAPAQSRHPGNVVQWAREFGYDAQEIEGYDTDQLVNTLRRMEGERTISRQMSGQRVEAPANGQQRAPQPVAEPAKPQRQPFKIAIPDHVKEELTVIPGFLKWFQEELPNLIEAETGKLHTELENSNQRLTQAEKVVQEREAESTTQRLDRIFTGLGREWEQVFGRGSAADGTLEDQDLQSRIATVAQARQLAQVRGGRPEQHIKAAAMALYGRFVQPPSREEAPSRRPSPSRRAVRRQQPIEVEDEPGFDEQNGEAWYNGGLQRGTGRSQRPEPKGHDRAVRAVTERVAERFAPIHDGYGREEDGLPD